MNYRALFKIIKNPSLVRLGLSMAASTFLENLGWIESRRLGLPVDGQGRPVPWTTYPFIRFVEPRLNRDLSVFEYGAGNSTAFFSARCGSVDSVEHDERWVALTRSKLDANASVAHVALDYDGKYARFPTTKDRKYDVIFVDGRDRNNCMRQSLGCLSSRGVLVLDDSERAKYAPGVEGVTSAGFRRLDFWGFAPGVFFEKCTSVFYRADNCLAI